MDFSSVPRALESLIRRQPPVDGAILEACYHLKDLFSSPCQVDEEGVEPPPLVAPGEVALSALTVLLRHDTRWEALAVGLCTSTTLLAGQRPSSVYVEGPRVPEIVPSSAALAGRVGGMEAARGHDATTNPNVVPSIHKSTDDNGLDGAVVVQLSPEQAHLLCQHVHRVCLKHLDHGEPRVRTLVAKSIPAYLCWNPQDVEREYAQELYGRLVASIRQHLEEGRDTLRGEHSKSSAGALDDTTGWRALETNWLCLKALIHALIQSHYYRILPLESTVLEDCRHSAVSHVSRHIRAAAMHALEQWILAAAATADPDQSHSLLQDPSSPLRQTTVAVLRSGMADNWSQVRMAASVLCRVFLTTLQQQSSSVSTVEQPARTPPLEWLKAHSDVCSVVLPRLCLNRYYSAHGVKLYSHETWVTIVHDRGIDIVAQSLPAFVRYDIQMCDADSHSVREAACQALAELVRRLGSHDTYRDQFANHIEPILQALVVCFHDESWPVRDEAGLACAVLCKSYPDLCRSELKLLWDRWTEQVTNNCVCVCVCMPCPAMPHYHGVWMYFLTPRCWFSPADGSSLERPATCGRRTGRRGRGIPRVVVEAVGVGPETVAIGTPRTSHDPRSVPRPPRRGGAPVPSHQWSCLGMHGLHHRSPQSAVGSNRRMHLHDPRTDHPGNCRIQPQSHDRRHFASSVEGVGRCVSRATFSAR